MLRRLHNEMVDERNMKLERKKSKRERILQLFRWRKGKPQKHNDVRPSTLVYIPSRTLAYLRRSQANGGLLIEDSDHRQNCNYV